ncbi:MAG: hypothetical protein ABSG83_06965 [Roseiarcus sp.]|jgi:hypothetical protein
MIARVFVPLVGANGESAQVFEAIAGDSAPEAHPARLLPQISELFDFGLYGIGQTVREAVTRFVDARRAKLWLGRRNGRVNPWNLRISDLQIGRLSDENARSAGLGLALAAICQAFGRDPGVVFATGEIKLPGGPGAPVVAVGPVDGLRGKLTLVGDYIVQHRKTLAGARMTVVLPATTPEGRSLASAEASTLARLQAEATDAGAAIDFVFADTLDGVEAALGPFAMREIVTPARALGIAAAACALAILVGAWTTLIHAPIDLAWAPVKTAASATRALAPAAEDATPQRARYDSATENWRLLGPCYDEQHEPLVIGGETLLIRVTAQDALPYASKLRPPRIFIASVSRAADPVILDAEHFFLPQNGALPSEAMIDLKLAVPIEPVEDEVEMFVVATRDQGLELTALQEELRRHLQGLSGAAVLTTTQSFLQDRAGAEVDYHFRVTNEKGRCPT